MRTHLQTQIRTCVIVIIAGLFISGVTAFPLETELQWLVQHSSVLPVAMQQWLNTIYQAIRDTNEHYPYLSYGTDWLAFAHLVLAILFVGPLKDPVRNIWVIQFGMIASVLIVPLAFIAGHIRHIPFFWQLIDCSFGVICSVPLLICYYKIKRLAALEADRLQYVINEVSN
ncbi:hypothetical protein LLH06_16220 [Mucilaginibacter daejeonensis]|uniref:hypothetical protein n=1 Tax=Mucilaginibacter daejeonensis TaxID=398049 RepID=UPI001D17B281|nr:hypothetical protein [Mucilaginibacter daejeonensis]UEG52504.1 hypothetical protein LLH06_16220 [Mucilaginibacter daejeonensis]